MTSDKKYNRVTIDTFICSQMFVINIITKFHKQRAQKCELQAYIYRKYILFFVIPKGCISCRKVFDSRSHDNIRQDKKFLVCSIFNFPPDYQASECQVLCTEIQQIIGSFLHIGMTKNILCYASTIYMGKIHQHVSQYSAKARMRSGLFDSTPANHRLAVVLALLAGRNHLHHTLATHYTIFFCFFIYYQVIILISIFRNSIDKKPKYAK